MEGDYRRDDRFRSQSANGLAAGQPAQEIFKSRGPAAGRFPLIFFEINAAEAIDIDSLRQQEPPLLFESSPPRQRYDPSAADHAMPGEPFFF